MFVDFIRRIPHGLAWRARRARQHVRTLLKAKRRHKAHILVGLEPAEFDARLDVLLRNPRKKLILTDSCDLRRLYESGVAFDYLPDPGRFPQNASEEMLRERVRWLLETHHARVASDTTHGRFT